MAEDHSPARARRWRKGYEEVVVAVVILLGAIYFRLNIETYVNGRQGAFLGPSFWPGLLLSLAIVLSAVYLVLAIRWARREDPPEVAATTVDAPVATTTGATTTEAGATTTAAGVATTPAGATPEAGTTSEAGVTSAPATLATAGGSHGSTAVGAVGPDTDPAPHADEEEHTGSVWKLLGGFALLAAYIYLLDPIGFIPASVLFGIGFMLLVGERRWYVLLVFPVVAVTVLLGIFTQLLVVALPRGSGVFLDLSTYFY